MEVSQKQEMLGVICTQWFYITIYTRWNVLIKEAIRLLIECQLA